MVDQGILRELNIIYVLGEETLTNEEQILMEELKDRFTSPFDWRCMSSRTRPFFIKTMSKKLYHTVYEGFLQSFLIRIIVVVETMLKQPPQIEVALKQLNVAANIFAEGSQKEQIFIASRHTLNQVFYSTVAMMYEKRGHLRKSLQVLQFIQTLPSDDDEHGILSGIKAIVSSYYGIEGLIAAMEECVSPTDSPVFELERRFLLVVILPQVSEIDFTEDVIRQVTHHMGFAFNSERNKPASTFAHYWRLTTGRRQVGDAMRTASEILKRLQLMGERSPGEQRAADLQMVRALETGPCNVYILTTAAHYFYLRRQVHKSFWLYWVGRTNYRACAIGLFQTLSMLYPGSEAVNYERLLRYFTPISSLEVIKAASLYLLQIDPRRALRLAMRALRVQVRLWNGARVPRNLRYDKAEIVCCQRASFTFLELMCCLAGERRGQMEADDFAEEVGRRVPRLVALQMDPQRTGAILLELQQLLHQFNLPRLLAGRTH